MIDALLSLARARRLEGKPDEALSLYRQASAVARGTGDMPALVHALRHVSDLERERDPREASRVAEEAIEICQAYPGWSQLEHANALRLQALALAAVNEHAKSLEAWKQARTLYDEAGIAAGVAECDAQLGALQ